MKEIIGKLNEQIKFAIDNNEVLDEASFGYEYGAIVTINEAKKIVGALESVSNQQELLVMPMLTDIEVKSGWEAWLNNSFKAYKKDFSDKLRKSNKRSGVIEAPKKWIENYCKELLEITERYLNASKHLS